MAPRLRSAGVVARLASRILPQRHSCLPQVVIDLEEAEVFRLIYRLVVKGHLSCRQITQHLNEARLPTPSGQN